MTQRLGASGPLLVVHRRFYAWSLDLFVPEDRQRMVNLLASVDDLPGIISRVQTLPESLFQSRPAILSAEPETSPLAKGRAVLF